MGMIVLFVLRAGLIGRRNSWEEVAEEAEVCRNEKRSPRNYAVVTEKMMKYSLPWNPIVTFQNLKSADIEFLPPWKLCCLCLGLCSEMVYRFCGCMLLGL